ncbi:MAG: sugar phosphate isomerase/epimerase [Oscillospiraceae bacterium]|jgi:sugar phosphate isomerase/epimerase|nr:sugar phosphate isomerase/epimerase [Oscillospiraceae bacterium]
MLKGVQQKLGIFLWFGYRIPVPERIRMIRETGFETILHWWDDSFAEIEGFSKEEQVALIRNEGLTVENAHLQADRVNDLWLDTQDGQTALDEYIRDIDSLAEQEIPVAVLHPSSGKEPPPVSAIGMKRFRLLVEKAEKRGVRLALENVRNTHILTKILDTIDSPMLGFCYDSGHDFIWSGKPYELMERYKSRLFAVHLHDNMGYADDHLAPGKGNINWDIVRKGIENSIYTGSYTLESDSAEIPRSRSPQEHLKMHFDGAKAMLLQAQR